MMVHDRTLVICIFLHTVTLNSRIRAADHVISSGLCAELGCCQGSRTCVDESDVTEVIPCSCNSACVEHSRCCEDYVTVCQNVCKCDPVPTWLNIRITKWEKWEDDKASSLCGGNMVHYVCVDGYIFTDSSGESSKQTRCNFQGQWQPDFEQCEEDLDSDADDMYWKPTEAPGAYLFGMFALVFFAIEMFLLIVIDCSNLRRAFKYCAKNTCRKPKSSTKRNNHLFTNGHATGLRAAPLNNVFSLQLGHGGSRPIVESTVIDVTRNQHDHSDLDITEED